MINPSIQILHRELTDIRSELANVLLRVSRLAEAIETKLPKKEESDARDQSNPTGTD